MAKNVKIAENAEIVKIDKIIETDKMAKEFLNDKTFQYSGYGF